MAKLLQCVNLQAMAKGGLQADGVGGIAGAHPINSYIMK
jgi:hypothetical protein